ncbi:MAG: FAD-dependent oxidoreductase [Deltaproteobacteria bacterium]|nr:FAD-dependent oxidoreductase [Deltaproteobacteria bacterium]
MRNLPSFNNNRKKAILLVGSGYGALKVAQDLSQSGLPLVWVTKAIHFLELPGGVKHFTEWPVDLDFQFRPLYLQVTRHPLVTAMTHARVEVIKQGTDGYEAVIIQDPIYVNYDLCTGCGRCMDICPLKDTDHPPLRRTPAYCPSRALDLDKRKMSPCRASCPLGVNVQAYMALTAAYRFDEALTIIREDNPLPGICGRVCHHPCEEACRRSMLDQSVAICDIKRFLADQEMTKRTPQLPIIQNTKRSEKIAIIGGGPAGLTAAYFLNREGFGVTIFEAHHEAGGILRVGINAFRLPRHTLNAEIQAIVDAGVKIKTDTPVHSVKDLLDQGFKAVLLCTGAHRDLRLNVPGEDSDGVFGALQMLKNLNTGRDPNIRGRVVIIGGGNSSIDAARSAIRLGADSVTICYRRKRKDMPAHASEIKAAEEEGVKIEYLAAPIRIVSRKGKVSGLTMIRMKLGAIDESGRRKPEPVKDSEFFRPADTVIVATGQQPHLQEGGLGSQFIIGRGGRISVDERLSTSYPGVFAAGDVVTGPDTVVGSMAQGRRAAARVVEYLTAAFPLWGMPPDESRGTGEHVEISADTPRKFRPEMSQRQPKVRRHDFEEVDLGLTAEQAVAEAGRCIQCRACSECRLCESVCTEIGAIDHFISPRRMTITSPTIIIASDEEAAHLNLADGKEIYHVGDFRRAKDLVNVLIAGSSSAGQAMAECSALRITGPPARPERVEPDRDVRFGVFTCTCNGTLAPAGVLDRIRDMGRSMPGVAHSELIFSACHPRGSELIADAVRKHKLNRVILASCVCCPLEFQCISCNDQRNRARIHLFDRLGLDRYRFETINIKDHLGSPDSSEDSLVERMRDFLREAFIRARFMGPLRQGVSKIGNRILILGGSEVGLSCALNLNMQGLKVRLIHRCRLKGEGDLPKDIRERPANRIPGECITHVEEALIEGIRGHLGDFTVTVREDGVRKNFHADIVCLTDLNVLPLAIPEGMFGLKKFYRYNFKFFHSPQIGVYRVMPRTLKRVTAFQAGAALAAHVATTAAEAFLKDHELSPRVNKGRCRGCGRCVEICPFDAVTLVANERGFFTAEVLRYNCVGCGGCVGRCPVTAMDMPYFTNCLLEEIVAGTLAGEE